MPRACAAASPSASWRGERAARAWHRQRAGGEPLGEVQPLDQLHHQEGAAVRLADLVQRGDRRVGERGEGARLALEARAAVGIGEDGVGQRLDRHLAAQAVVDGAVDLAHPTRPERRDDFVGSEPGTREQRHGDGRIVLPRAREAGRRRRAVESRGGAVRSTQQGRATPAATIGDTVTLHRVLASHRFLASACASLFALAALASDTGAGTRGRQPRRARRRQLHRRRRRGRLRGHPHAQPLRAPRRPAGGARHARRHLRRRHRQAARRSRRPRARAAAWTPRPSPRAASAAC